MPDLLLPSQLGLHGTKFMHRPLLLCNRNTCVCTWTACPSMYPKARRPGVELLATCRLLIVSPAPSHYATETHINLILLTDCYVFYNLYSTSWNSQSVQNHSSVSFKSLKIMQQQTGWITGWRPSVVDRGVVCLLAAYCGANSPLARAMGCH